MPEVITVNLSGKWVNFVESSFQIRRTLLSSGDRLFGHRLTLLTRPASIVGGSHTPLRRKALTASLVGFLLSTTALANPQGGQVVGGSATIVESGPKRLDVIQHTPRAVIDWRSFDIAGDEHTNFAQPSSSAVALNRVTAGGASQIRGRLTANGTVMLINPHGVIFGPSARVDVAGLVASTADIRNSDAMAGRFVFDLPGQPDAVIRNEGEITVADHGLVAMVAPWVANTGRIQARLGRVTLASGEAFTLDPYGDSLVEVMLTEAPAGRDGARIVNDGLIAADGGVVTLSADAVKSAFDQAINMTGVIEARSVASANGVIRLRGGNGETRVAGRLDASGQTAGTTGGRVEVRGRRVSLADNAMVLASGRAGGGNVKIGGDLHGKGPDQQAETTLVAAAARIEADALDAGHGGDVVIWADDTTRFHGSVSARGGAASGDGGFVEVSGKERLQFAGSVDASAPAGAAGTLLLDPRNITVRAGGEAEADDVDDFGDGDDPDAALVIAPATLDAVMASVVLQATEDITIDDAVNLTTNGAGLTAQAGRNITVNAGITTRGGDITLSANDPGTTQANGSITVNAALNTAGGGQSGGAVALDVNGGDGGITLGADIATSNADVTVNGPTTLSDDVAIASGGGDITFAGSLNGGQDLTLAAGGGDISLQGAVGGSSRLAALQIDNARDVVANAITATSLRQVAGSGTTTINGAIDTSGGSGIELTGNAFAFNAAVSTSNGGGVRIVNSGNLSIAAAADLDLDGAFAQVGTGTVSLAGDITTTDDAISFAGLVTLTGNVALDTGNGSGNITFADTLDGGQILTLTAGSGDIAFQAAAGGSNRLGALTINSARDVTSTSLRSASLRQVAGTGTTTLNGALNTNAAAGIDLDGNAFAINAGVTTTNGGNVRITNTGNLGFGAAADLDLDGAFAQDGAGGVSLAGSIATTGDAISFVGAVSLTAAAALNSDGGDITFAGTLDGGQDLSLTAGAGDIAFQAAAGGISRLGALTINSARVVNVNALTATSLRQVAGSGTTTFAGALNTNGAAGIDLVGNGFDINAGVTTSSGGGVRIGNTGDLSIVADLNLDGAFHQDGGGATSLTADITTSNDVIAFAGLVNLAGARSLDSGAAGVSFAGDVRLLAATLTANGPLTLGSGAEDRITALVGPAAIATSNDRIVVNGVLLGVQNVTIDSGTAETVFNADVGRFVSGGDTFLVQIGNGTGAALDLRSQGETIFNGEVFARSGITASGDVRFRDDVTLQAGDTDSRFTGTTIFDAAGSSLTFATGGTVTFDGDVSLLRFASLQVTQGPVAFNAGLNGPSTLSTVAGGNDVIFNGAVGTDTRLGINVFNARDILFNQGADVSSANLRASRQIDLGRQPNGGIDATGTIDISGDADVDGDLQTAGSIRIDVSGDIDVNATANNRLTVDGGNISGRFDSIGADPNLSEVTLTSSERIDAEVNSTGKVTLTGGSGITATVAAGGVSELVTTADINASVTTQDLRVSGTSTADLTGSVGGNSGVGGARLIDIFLINDDSLRGPFFFNGIDILNLENFVVTRTTLVPPVEPRGDFGFGGQDVVPVPITISSEQDLAAQLGLSLEEARALIALAKQAEDSGTTVVAQPGGTGSGTIVVAARSGTEVREGGSGFAAGDTAPGPVQVADSFGAPDRSQSQDLSPQEAAAIEPAGGTPRATNNEEDEETEASDGNGATAANTGNPTDDPAPTIRITALYTSPTPNDGTPNQNTDLAATSASQFSQDYRLIEPLPGADTAFPGLKDFNRPPWQ